MKNPDLSAYLNDHLAGSVTALELVDHLIDSDLGSELKAFLKNLRNEIQADQQTLENLMDILGVSENKLKSATAWIVEKAGRIKLHATDENDLALLQSLEGLVLGITGKKALWEALSALDEQEAGWKEIDLAHLKMRAVQQCEAVEIRRLEAARRILSK